jgi:hypothetical protein
MEEGRSSGPADAQYKCNRDKMGLHGLEDW